MPQSIVDDLLHRPMLAMDDILQQTGNIVIERQGSPHAGSDKLHWNELDDQEKQTATKAVSELDGFHIVTVGAPVPAKNEPGPGASTRWCTSCTAST